MSLAFGLWVSRLIEDLFAHAMVLGWFGIGLLVLLGLAVLALAVRETVGVFRQAKVARLHQALAAARLADDRDAARGLMVEVAALYAARPETARGRAEVARAATEIVDGRDLIDVAEAALLLPIDRIVASEIAGAAKRVSLVTAISPRAVIDLIFVGGQSVWLIRPHRRTLQRQARTFGLSEAGPLGRCASRGHGRDGGRRQSRPAGPSGTASRPSSRPDLAKAC